MCRDMTEGDQVLNSRTGGALSWSSHGRAPCCPEGEGGFHTLDPASWASGRGGSPGHVVPAPNLASNGGLGPSSSCSVTEPWEPHQASGGQNHPFLTQDKAARTGGDHGQAKLNGRILGSDVLLTRRS